MVFTKVGLTIAGAIGGKAGGRLATKVALENGTKVLVKTTAGGLKAMGKKKAAALIASGGATAVTKKAALKAAQVQVPLLGAMSATNAARLAGAATIGGGLYVANEMMTPAAPPMAYRGMYGM